MPTDNIMVLLGYFNLTKNSNLLECFNAIEYDLFLIGYGLTFRTTLHIKS